VEPLESLQRNVFPKADEVLLQVESGVFEPFICVQAFLQWLKTTTKIFLQDAVMFRAEHADNVLFTHPIFRDPEFLEFERVLLAICHTSQVPADIQLQQAMPLISQQLQEIRAKLDANQCMLQQLMSEDHRRQAGSRFSTRDE
jgi:hypothetical protein